MLYFKLYPFTLIKHLVVSHSYLCIWVNYCSIISQEIIYLKVFKRWISILNLALFCSTLPVALLVVDLPPSHSLLLWFAQDLESLCSLQSCLRLNLSSFVLPNTSSRSARCRLVSVSIFAALVCSTPPVDLLVVDFLISTVETVCFNISCFVLKPRLILLAVQLSLAAI